MPDNEFKKVTTVGELKAAIKDLPDDMPVCKWDGDYNMIYPWVNGAPSTMYDLDGDGSWSIYGGYDDNHSEPTQTMLTF